MTAPLHCGYCGRPAQRHTQRLWNPFNGSIDAGSARNRDACPPGTTRETWTYHGNGIVLRKDVSKPGNWGSNSPAFLHSVTVWDGETWRLDYDPFCTIRCAQSFAEAAWRAGYRVTSTGKD